jgi:S1-C subfamily serine protease
MAQALFHDCLHDSSTTRKRVSPSARRHLASCAVVTPLESNRPIVSKTSHPSGAFGRLKLLFALFACCLCFAESARADDMAVEQAAAALLKATVTVRILPARPAKQNVAITQPAPTTPKLATTKPATGNYNLNEDAIKEIEIAAAAEEPTGVLVSSGVSLGSGLILTFSQLPAPDTNLPTAEQSQSPAPVPSPGPEYRVTLPDGEQAQAEPRVIDQYSGLVLLEIKQQGLPGLSLATQLPRIGGSVLSASAAGIDKPLVSLGVLSGIERTVPGASLPPMLQCDISTTEASSGAALIDREQQLIGIIAATDASSQNFGWSFAIPYQHIRRVVEARSPGKLVVLARQRAIVGLKLGPGPQDGTVQVEHVVPGGPADQAGIRQGEIVLEAEGRKLRSAYQAVALILKRLPGDEMTFVIGTEKSHRIVKVKLGGGAAAAVPAVPGDEGRYQVGAQVEVNLLGPNRYEVRNGQRVKELNVNGQATNEAQQRAPASETELLMRQLQAYQDLIVVLQKERLDRQNQDQAQAKVLDSLRNEIGTLKQQLEGQKATGKAK